jgi:hypothetical protein
LKEGGVGPEAKNAKSMNYSNLFKMRDFSAGFGFFGKMDGFQRDFAPRILMCNNFSAGQEQAGCPCVTRQEMWAGRCDFRSWTCLKGTVK